MYVKIKSLDNSKSCVLFLSKLSKVKEMKSQILDTLEVPVDKQRLFYKGKQLEDQYSLFDYDVNLNDVIQLMIKAEVEDLPIVSTDSEKENIQPTRKTNETEDLGESSNVMVEKDENLKPAESEYYKVGDYVDAIEEASGSWFESQIIHILVDKNIVKYDDKDLTFKVIHLRYKDEGNSVTFDDIRPLAKHLISKLTEDFIGVKVMGNYNQEDPKERGYWHNMVIEKKHGRRLTGLAATVYFGIASSETSLENCKIKFVKELYKIETAKLISERTEEDEKHMTSRPEKLRQIVPECTSCNDIETEPCKDCGCSKCAGKDSCDKLLMCEECQSYYHIWCLNPPLEKVPEDDWFCPDCKRDTSEVITPGQKLKGSKKKEKMASANSKSNRDWGKGMACVGRTKVCDIVPSDHFGPIPGVEVGQSYLYRLQASEAGVHRPHVSGIHGRENTGAFSIVLSGGYEDDVDNGETFDYTGSGGRDLSGNKRTSVQSFDQTLTRMNKALAKNCNAPIDDVKGNEAIDWKKGKPVRVMRNAKAAKHSKYAPAEGNRYDGIYKVVKYYPVKGNSNCIVWRYHLRRDDEVPAPWTEKGKKRIKELGLQMVYPEGYEEAQAAKSAKEAKDNKSLKRKADTESDSQSQVKKVKQEYELPSAVQDHLSKDTIHASLWEEVKALCKEGRKKVLERLQEKFLCIICQELVHTPITLECVHTFCRICLKRALNIDSEARYSCPCCRREIDKSVLETHVNNELQSILSLLFPGYCTRR